MSGVYLRYQYRVYPSPGQCVALARSFGCARLVWNDALALRRQARGSGERISCSEVAKRVTTLAKKTPQRLFLSEVSSVVLQQSLRDFEQAWRNFYASTAGKRKGPKVAPPKFKKRVHRQSIRFNTNAFDLKANGKLYLAKVGDIDVRWSRQLPAEPSSVTIVKDSSGRYFCSFVVDVGESEPLPVVEGDTGIDVGLSTFAVLKDRVIVSPKFFRQAERKIRKANRELSRKQKGSNNRRKARVKLAKVHARVADRRRDFIEQETTRIVRENQAVYTEDLNVKGIAIKTGRRGKSVHDQALGTFLRTLESKCARYGRGFVKVNRWFPSTQMCSVCGALTGPSGLAGLTVRAWRCPCGAILDRDANAEANIRAEGRQILAAGQAENLNACGAQIRPVPVPAPRREAGTHRSAGNRGLEARTTSAAGIPGLRAGEDVKLGA